MTRDKLQVGAEQSPKCWEIMGNEAALGSVLVTLLHLDQMLLVRGPRQTVFFLASILLSLHHFVFFSSSICFDFVIINGAQYLCMLDKVLYPRGTPQPLV